MEGDGGWCIYFEILDDKGKIWKMVGFVEVEMSVFIVLCKVNVVNVDDQEGGEVIKGEGEKFIYVIQFSILCYKDGCLQVFCCICNVQIVILWSSDNGEIWSKVILFDVFNNNLGMDVVIMKDGCYVLIYNDFSILLGILKGLCILLCVVVLDDGIYWKNVMILEDSFISQYFYLFIIQGKDGKLYVVYIWCCQCVVYKELDLSKLK